MFYSEIILTKKGPLALIWLAAHWDQRLTKNQIMRESISDSAAYVIKPVVKLSLRTSGHLLLGVVKLYSRKVKYVLHDVNEAMSKMRLQSLSNPRLDLGEKNQIASFTNITLPPPITTAPNMNAPDPQSAFLLEDNVLMDRITNLLKDGEGTDLLDDWELEGTVEADLLSQSLLNTPVGLGGDERRTPGTNLSRASRYSTEVPLFSQNDEEDALKNVIEFPNLFDDVQGVTSGRPSDAHPIEIGLGGDDMPSGPPMMQGLDDQGGDEIHVMDEVKRQVEMLKPAEEKKRTGKKRRRPAHWDEVVTIDKDVYRNQMKNTDKITLERPKIRRVGDSITPDTSVQTMRRGVNFERMTNKQVLNYFFSNPISGPLPGDVMRVYRNGMKRMKPPSSSNRMMDEDELEVDQQQEQQEQDQMGMGGDDGGGDEMVAPPPGGMDGMDRLMDDLSLGTQDQRRMTLDGTQTLGDDSVPMFDDSQVDRYKDAGVEKDVFAPVTDIEKLERARLDQKLKERNLQYSSQTVNFLAKLKAGFQSVGTEERDEDEDDDEDEEDCIRFDRLFGRGGRREAAQGFYQLLELGSKKMLDPIQKKPYGEIRMKKTNLFEETIMGN